MANSVDPDSAASHLGLHCLLWPVYPNTYGKCGLQFYKSVRYFFMTQYIWPLYKAILLSGFINPNRQYNLKMETILGNNT